MSEEFAIAALEVAVKHLLFGTALLGLIWAVLRWRLLGPNGRANLLLLALPVLIAAPLLSTVYGDPRGPETINTGAARPDAAGPGALPTAPSARADTGDWMVPPQFALALLTIWGIGAGWRLSRLLAGHWRLRAVMAEAEVLPHHAVAAGALVPDHVELLLTRDFGPAVVGVLKPKILLPRAIVTSATAVELHAVLLHESAHIARRDAIGHGLQRVVQAVLWWSPVVHWLVKKLDVAREVACDARAAGRCGNRERYALALVDLVEQLGLRNQPQRLPAVAMATTLKGLDERVEVIIAPQDQPSGIAGWLRRMALLTCAITALGVGTLALAQGPRLGLDEQAKESDVNMPAAPNEASAPDETIPQEISPWDPSAVEDQHDAPPQSRVDPGRKQTVPTVGDDLELRALEIAQRRQASEWEAEVRNQRRAWENEERRQREEWQAERARQETEWQNERQRQKEEYALKLQRLRAQQAARP